MLLKSDRIDYGQTHNNGRDLRFVDANGTVLPHEIESWNQSGISLVWVRVPTMKWKIVDDFTSITM